MSGQMFYKDEFSAYLKRRSFLLRIGLITGGIFLNSCYKKIRSAKYNIQGALQGPDANAGHLLRDKLKLPSAKNTRKVKTLIVGSGISGLSAGRWLKKNGETDFEILELEKHIGGNSYFGSNKIASYPLGAHYITIANNDDALLIDFLKEIDVITHFEGQLPYYNDYYLTFDPEERLLINGAWQEGLIPDFGVPIADKKEVRRFLAEVDQLKNTRGNDGKFLFNIPLNSSSTDENYRKLDKITFEAYLKEKGYRSKYLLWYLNYACKDDYGQKISHVSAWAGLHYFASRRGMAANAAQNAILTWPEGNGWIMKKLAEQLKAHIKTSNLCYELKPISNGNTLVTVWNTKTQLTENIEVEKIILCAPQFVNNRLLENFNRNIDYKAFNYSPWLIANITTNELPESKGVSLCWDNVAYNTSSVGYVNAAQQHLNLSEDKKVITYYLPLCDFEPAIARLAAYSRNYEQWLDIVIPELEVIHPGITKAIETIDFWVWGHGMITPAKDFIWSKNLEKAKLPIDNKIFFAHSDLSGVSIFEEAFHQGINAAKQVINATS
ncbi:NAD(P)-binding Rossmann-like domain-containing protein [Pedobacter suwonensis]|uniref:NAD(P)-binding Rossmann-like domain-containing protein n=1 Tax=Pedobacter suwonensis TaxID=332999 RepID=A0A1I0U7D1_9SPHI|nr:NAD(P)/FAD-dependent oxidoreductase [Pedobacter suwonensis]SFA59961.1 NAD(P)-binding Rossmann-like domain-containing protein [Pedobacter suwonensis]